MKNAYQDGRVLDLKLAAAVESGGVISQGKILAIAVSKGAIGDTVAGHVEGVFRLPKLGTAVIAAGDPVTWDINPGRVIVAGATAGDVAGIGYAVEAAGNGVATVLVRLTPGTATITA